MQTHPASPAQELSHPSPFEVFPSSHCSLPTAMPSPHTAPHTLGDPKHDHPTSTLHVALHPSPALRLPSSQLSAPDTVPSPQLLANASLEIIESERVTIIRHRARYRGTRGVLVAFLRFIVIPGYPHLRHGCPSPAKIRRLQENRTEQPRRLSPPDRCIGTMFAYAPESLQRILAFQGGDPPARRYD